MSTKFDLTDLVYAFHAQKVPDELKALKAEFLREGPEGITYKWKQRDREELVEYLTNSAQLFETKTNRKGPEQALWELAHSIGNNIDILVQKEESMDTFIRFSWALSLTLLKTTLVGILWGGMVHLMYLALQAMNPEMMKLPWGFWTTVCYTIVIRNLVDDGRGADTGTKKKK